MAKLARKSKSRENIKIRKNGAKSQFKQFCKIILLKGSVLGVLGGLGVLNFKTENLKNKK
jgi:hypothetical protein